jgi:hypothetical protein
MDRAIDKCAVKIGGAVLVHQNKSDLDFLFSGSPMWEEESSSEIHILNYNIEHRKFVWTSVKVPSFGPRAFHSAVVIGNNLFVFGGLNLKTGERYCINPLKLCLITWTVTEVIIDGLHGFLSGAGITASSDHIYLVGGYTQQEAKEKDNPCDTVVQIAFDEGNDKCYLEP